MKNRKTQGFTLIELLIVIAIIGILAAVLIPNLLGARSRAYDTAAQSCAKAIATYEETYQIDSNTYNITVPTTSISSLNTCKDISISSATGNSTTAYAFTTSHGQGKRLFTVTPSGITGS